MTMTKKPARLLRALLIAFVTYAAHAQFISGQVLTAAKTNNASAAITGGTITGLPSVTPIGSGGTVVTAATGSGSVDLQSSPSITTSTVSGSVALPFTISGLKNISETGHWDTENNPTVNINISEALNYTASYVTHYGMLLKSTELSGGTGDRIGLGSIQTCNATLAGKSCVGATALAVAGGNAVGNYTGSNLRALVPAGLTGPVGEAAPLEADIETHSPVLIRDGLRIADENQSGGPITHGKVEDTAIAIVTDTTTGGPGFNVGIQFGEDPQGYPQYWPILVGGTLIQASNPSVSLAYGLDLSRSTGGFSKQAVALPQNTTGGGIQWGTAGTAGMVSSTATTTGGFITFTNSGIQLNNSSNGILLNVGGTTGSDVINSGYMTEASLTGYVYCNGSRGRCQASTYVGLAGTTKSIGGTSLAAGACSSGTVAIAGTTTSMAVVATPVTYPGDGDFWHGYVSAAGTVTVKVCAAVASTPTASAYNVRVLQ
jgi:hypothetical protein